MLGDIVEAPDGPLTVGLAHRDTYGTYWVSDATGGRRYPVEVIRWGIVVGQDAEVSVEAYYRWIKAKLERMVLSPKEYQAWSKRLSIVDVEGGWVWKPVRVLRDGDPCLIENADGDRIPLPRNCIRGLAR